MFLKLILIDKEHNLKDSRRVAEQPRPHSIQQSRSVRALGHYRIALYYNTLDDIPFSNCNLEPHANIDTVDESSAVSATTRLSESSDEETHFPSSANEVLTPSETFDDCAIASGCERLVGSHVLVKYALKRSVVHFAAVVEGNITENGDKLVNINYLKLTGKNAAGNCTFVFPDVANKDTVSEENFVMGLPVPNVGRGTYVFQVVKFPDTTK